MHCLAHTVHLLVSGVYCLYSHLALLTGQGCVNITLMHAQHPQQRGALFGTARDLQNREVEMEVVQITFLHQSPAPKNETQTLNYMVTSSLWLIPAQAPDYPPYIYESKQLLPLPYLLGYFIMLIFLAT